MNAQTSAGPTSPVRELLRQVARAFGPISRLAAGTRWFRLWSIVHHRGRRSGKPYATPVAARRTADGFMIPITFGRRTSWAQNVLAAGSCAIRWGGADYEVANPIVVPLADAEVYFNRLQRSLLRRFAVDRFLRVVIVAHL